MRSDESDLLLELYRGVADQNPWHRFLARLADRTQAGRSAIILAPELPVFDPSPQPNLRIFGADIPPFEISVLLRLRYQRVYAADELTGGNPAPFARILRLRVDGGGDVWLYLGRNSDDFSASTGALMSGFGPHLGVAAGAYLRQFTQQSAMALTQDIAARMGAGWLTLNGQGIILSASIAGLQILASVEPVFGQIGARLMLDSNASKRVSEALSAFVAGTSQEPIAVRLPFAEMILRPFANPFPGAPIATAYLRAAAHQPQTPPILALSQMANITPSEARFALKLASGRSISEAAKDLDLTIETARNYSKKIYAKMGLRGQSDLVRALENSAIFLI